MKSKTRYAILGILKTLGPKSGYALKKTMAESTAYFWSESFGSLYPTLAQLEKEGAIEPREKGARRSVIYSITAKGSVELEKWLFLPAEESRPRSEMLLKLFFSTERPKEVTCEQLRAFRARAQEQVQLFKQMAEQLRKSSSGDSLKYWLMTVRLGQLQSEVNFQWCNECLEELR